MFRSMTTLTAGIVGLLSLAAPALAGPHCAPYSCAPCYSYGPCYSPCYSYAPPCYGYGYRAIPVYAFDGPDFDEGPAFSAPRQQFNAPQQFSAPQQRFNAPSGRPNFAPSGPAGNGPSLTQSFSGGASRSFSPSTSNFTPQQSGGGFTRPVSNGGFNGGGLAQIPQNQGKAGVDTTPGGSTTQRFNIVAPPPSGGKPPVSNNNGRNTGRRR